MYGKIFTISNFYFKVRGVGGKKDTIFPPPRIRTIESEAQSLRDRSYLRPIKPYNPPTDAEEKLRSIFNEHLGSNGTTLSNGRIKFKVLSACNKEFDYAVPNSCLHKMNTIGKFFNVKYLFTNNFYFIYLFLSR